MSLDTFFPPHSVMMISIRHMMLMDQLKKDFKKINLTKIIRIGII